MNISNEQFHFPDRRNPQGELLPGPSRGEIRMAAIRRANEHLGDMDDDHTPDESYYKQDDNQQMVLPGMEMTPQQHVEAMGPAVGGSARLRYHSPTQTHRIEVYHRNPAGALNFDEKSTLIWNGRQFPVGPGEIQLVHSEKPGTASKMHAVARRIASEHPDIAMPRHSEHRTEEGVAWSRKEMKKYGEQVW